MKRSRYVNAPLSRTGVTVLPVFLLVGWMLYAGLLRAAERACDDAGDTAIWFSPQSPHPGDLVRVLAVSADAVPDELWLTDAEEGSRTLPATPRGGPPWSLEAEITVSANNAPRIEARRNGQTVGCREVASANRPVNGWDQTMEALYATWVEKLFDAPAESSMSFPSLEPVLRNSDQNFLYDYLGLGEDRRLQATPDCADLPYFLRSYFAWKIGLPMAFRACSRGTSAAPPRCGSPVIEQGFVGRVVSPSAYRGVTRRLMDTVHSGSARTGLADNRTDFYPIALERDTLWPGMVYADPYGHVLVIVKWIPQGPGQSGQLLAVDAQPDNSVTRKRFWEGTFLFAADVRSAGPGFKAFRPLAGRGDGSGPVQVLSNDSLVDDARFAAFSLEQGRLETDEFYARVGRMMNPRGLDPEQAYRSTLDALVEQLMTRVDSVDNGERYFRHNPRAVIAMPSGAAIFETIGPWEDYATPSRDMRLLIAMNVLASLPEKIVLHPEMFVLGDRPPDVVREEIEQLHRRSIQMREITYTRSEGSPQRLSIAEIFARQASLELGYNPNDCVEARWGAPPDSAEYSSCRRHAPPDQRARMENYRSWFRETRRPPR